jgi:hypothetical protein
MKVTHYCNSFNSFKAGNSTLVCDPWIGEGEQTSWVSYPIHKNGAQILKNINPNFIYISHLHCDHLDKDTLLKFKNKKIKIIIKKFKYPKLKNIIINLGFKNILECVPWKKYKLNKDISIAIIPQMTSNSSGLPVQINYDLDTSIVIQSNIDKNVFYNGVDNPLGLKDYKVVKKFISEKFNKKISVTVLQDAAASEYPQCFLNINRKKEKKRVVHNILQTLKNRVSILKPEVYYSPSPGSIISGKYSSLNKFLAHPKFEEVKSVLRNSNCHVFSIYGGNSIIKENGKWIVKTNNKKFNKDKITKKYETKKYFYTKNFKAVTEKKLDETFYIANENYKNRLSKIPIKTSWSVNFKIYKNLSLNKSGKINHKISKFIKEYSINFNHRKRNVKNDYTLLNCHIDLQLFYGLISKKYPSWNQPTSGSLVLYERKPNIFDPNLLFSLNFLTI